MNITVICGTDRPDSRTEVVARQYAQYIESQGYSVVFLNLREVFQTAIGVEYGNPQGSFEQVLHKMLVPAERIIAVVPEYNGSIPGALKYFIDLTLPEMWHGKRAALVGLGTGRGGNSRGLDHLTAVFHYLRMHVHHYKACLPAVHRHMDAKGLLPEGEYFEAIKKQFSGFMEAGC